MTGGVIERLCAITGLDEEVRGGTGRIRKRSYGSTLALFGHFGSVAKFKAAHKAGFNTDRQFAFSYTVGTAVALNGIAQIRINMGRTVRAGGFARTAANAYFGIYRHNAGFGIFSHGSRGACFGTCRIVTMLAAGGYVVDVRVFGPGAIFAFGKTAAFVVEYATNRVIRTEVLVVFAGQLAGLAAGATSRIKVESILSHRKHPP